MIRKSVLFAFIVTGLVSCNTSLKYFNKNAISCPGYYEVKKDAEIYFIKNKEFRSVSHLLKAKYDATSIRHIFFIKSKEIYYCEFYENPYSINCLILNKNLEIVSQEKLQFDY